MDRDRMLKVNWKPYMLLLYKPPRIEIAAEVCLISINFDDEILIVRPVDTELYKDEDAHVNLKHVELPKYKLKKV